MPNEATQWCPSAAMYNLASVRYTFSSRLSTHAFYGFRNLVVQPPLVLYESVVYNRKSKVAIYVLALYGPIARPRPECSQCTRGKRLVGCRQLSIKVPMRAPKQVHLLATMLARQVCATQFAETQRGAGPYGLVWTRLEYKTVWFVHLAFVVNVIANIIYANGACCAVAIRQIASHKCSQYCCRGICSWLCLNCTHARVS